MLGLRTASYCTENEGTPEFEPIAQAEHVLAASGARITWEGARAFYRPSTDEIYMPTRERFAQPVYAYAVALHELTHWTGHESRLGRDFSGRFGSEAYAFEELVAELGSAFVVAHLGLEGARLENHASYVQSWLKVLKNDKNAVFTASRHANAAYQLIMQKAGMTHVHLLPSFDFASVNETGCVTPSIPNPAADSTAQQAAVAAVQLSSWPTYLLLFGSLVPSRARNSVSPSFFSTTCIKSTTPMNSSIS